MTFFSILNCTAPASSHLQGRGGRERGERSGEREERERPNREAESRAGGARPAPPLPRRVRPPVAGWAVVILPPSLPDGHFPHAAERHVPSALPSTAGGRYSIRPTPPPPPQLISTRPRPAQLMAGRRRRPADARPGRGDSIALRDASRGRESFSGYSSHLCAGARAAIAFQAPEPSADALQIFPPRQGPGELRTEE